MIKRINDFTCISDNELEKIAATVNKKDNIKLFDIVDNEDQINLIEKELKVQGYQVKIESFGSKWKVFAIIPEKVNFGEAIESGAFKKLAWGRYSFQRESAIGMFKYDFDDGTIWRVMQGEDGQEYLVKEIDEENEEEVLRTKLASNNEIIVDENNIKKVMSILYNLQEDSEIISDLMGSNIKSSLQSILNDKLTNLIDKEIEVNSFIKSADYVKDLHGTIKTAFNNNELKSKDQISELIKKYSNEMKINIGKVNKLFN